MRSLRFVMTVVLCCTLGFVGANAQTAPAAESAPKLEHFDISRVDKSLDPCQDFYAYVQQVERR
jgi:hypothetical protein